MSHYEVQYLLGFFLWGVKQIGEWCGPLHFFTMRFVVIVMALILLSEYLSAKYVSIKIMLKIE